jgi:hypothetical protein
MGSPMLPELSLFDKIGERFYGARVRHSLCISIGGMEGHK